MAVAVLHLAIVGWCFRIAWRGHWARQEIEIDAETIRIGSRTVGSDSEQIWPAAWVRVERVALRSELRVFLALRQARIEIGRFLPEFERREAADLIAIALARRLTYSKAGSADRNSYKDRVSPG